MQQLAFPPYMLTHGIDKSMPLSFLYPEFATTNFDYHEQFVQHLVARQSEIHDLVRRNTHQAQLQQEEQYDNRVKAKAYAVGDAV